MEYINLFAIVFGLHLQKLIVSTLGAHQDILNRGYNCSVIAIDGEYYANCSNKSLPNAPNFSYSVYPLVGIDLSVNLLTTFPLHLPQTLKYLNVSANSLGRLTRHCIRNYPNLIELRMSKCNLKSLESHSLNGSQLRYLDVSGNRKLTLSVLRNISCDLMNSSIETLILNELQCPAGPSIVLSVGHVKCLQNTSLKTLSLASNRIVYFDFNVIPTLPDSLTVLNVSDNKLVVGLYAFQFCLLKSLKIIDFSYQFRIHEVDIEYIVCTYKEKNCNAEETELEQREQEPKMYNFNLLNYTLYFPPSLEKLYLHDCNLKFTFSHNIYKTGKHLSHVILRNNILHEWRTPLYGLRPVRYLDMSNNFCTIVHENVFAEGTNLIFLDLFHNILGDSFAKDKNGNIFRSLQKLEVLDISWNRITVLPYTMFQSTISLRELRISQNQITKFEVMIQHMEHLSLLDLSHNQIEALSSDIQRAINEIADKDSIKINVEGNPLNCICEHSDFITWLEKRHNIVFLNIKKYMCIFQNEKHALNSSTIQKFKVQCAPHFLLTVILFAVILIFTIGIICKILYRFRWRLRYLYYITAKQLKVGTAESKAYRYDAFISYASENEVLAIEIINDLEIKNNLRVCFHSRDFIPGTAIADNISNAIQNSRRTVCIVSSQFLESYWCMFEFNMARMVSFYSRAGENVLILVLLEKCSTNMMPLDLIDVIRSHSYLEYPGNFGDRESFTLQLAQHI